MPEKNLLYDYVDGYLGLQTPIGSFLDDNEKEEKATEDGSIKGIFKETNKGKEIYNLIRYVYRNVLDIPKNIATTDMFLFNELKFTRFINTASMTLLVPLFNNNNIAEYFVINELRDVMELIYSDIEYDDVAGKIKKLDEIYKGKGAKGNKIRRTAILLENIEKDRNDNPQKYKNIESEKIYEKIFI